MLRDAGWYVLTYEESNYRFPTRALSRVKEGTGGVNWDGPGRIGQTRLPTHNRLELDQQRMLPFLPGSSLATP